VTFTATSGASRPVRILVSEYNEDLTGIDSFVTAGVPTSLVTSGTTDLLISMSADSGVVTCSAITPASGFTLEFSENASCKSFSDEDSVGPGTHTVGPTLTGKVIPVVDTVAFGVAVVLPPPPPPPPPPADDFAYVRGVWIFDQGSSGGGGTGGGGGTSTDLTITSVSPLPPAALGFGAGGFTTVFSGGGLPTGWTIDTGPAPGNIGGVNTGTFAADHCLFNQGVLDLKLTQTGSAPVTSIGCEVRSNATYGYGTYHVIARPASTATTPTGAGTAVSGSDSSPMFTYLGTPDPSTTEIDSPEIEGQSPNNCEWTNWKTTSAKQGSITTCTGGSAFHDYSFTWSPGKIQFFYDGILAATHTSNVPTAPAYILTSLWGTNSTSFGGLATVGTTRHQYVKQISFSSNSGSDYNFQLEATGGVKPYNWSLLSGTLPPGLSLGGGAQLGGSDDILGSSTNWFNCFTVACAGGAADATMTNQTYGTTSVISMTGPPNSNSLWSYKLAGSDANAATVFTSDQVIQLDANGGTAQALEYDIFQFVGGRNYMFGSQCNQLGSGFWQIWDQLNLAWIDTPLACDISVLTDHRIKWAVHRVPGSTLMYYDTLTIDGTPHAINMSEPSSPTAFADAIGVHFQLDEGPSGTSLSETIKSASFTASTQGDGRISGTPTTAGTSTFTVQVSDAVAGTASKEFSLTVLPAGPRSVLVKWGSSTTATTYSVKRSTTNGGPYTTIAPGLAGLSYTDAAVTSGVTYYYVITAVNQYGESPNSAQVFATIP